jgi:molybdopterin-guanine dinucleotide biosynthesis protein A
VLRTKQKLRVEVCILAGGLSSRMGRDKSRLKLRGRTMLAHVRETAATLGLPVRVIRRDIVPRCGPLGGIITGFYRSRADALLFLACDMPFVTPAVLARVMKASAGGYAAVFATAAGRSGFPFILPRSALPGVEQQRAAENFSLRQLARKARAKRLRVPATVVFNVNTSEEFGRIRLH